MDAVEPISPLPPLEEYLSHLNRQLGCLLDGTSTPVQRKESFQQLSRLLHANVPKSHTVPGFKAALKPLLKRFGDDREQLRQAAIALITEAVKVLPDLVSYIHYIVPVLAYRMGTIDLSNAPITLGSNTAHHERTTGEKTDARPTAVAVQEAAKVNVPSTAEQSSAVRVALLKLLYEMVIRLTNRELEIFLPDLCQILYTSMQTDRDPEVKIKVCEILKLLSEDYSQPMRAFSRILMVPLMQRCLLDKSSSVRIVAIRAMGALIPCGAAEMIRDLCAFRESNVIDIHGFFHGEARVHYFARLVADSNRSVRSEFLKVINHWAVDLYERADYETLIMPYVFSGLSDLDPSIRSMTLDTMTIIGSVFEREEKERLANGVGGTAMDEGAFRLKLLAEEKSRQHYAQLAPLYFPPFTSRPPWGQRQVARKFLDRLLHAILSEKGDWQRDVSERSWLLLRLLLGYGEEHITQFSLELVKAFIQELVDVAKHATPPLEPMWHCVALVGRYADPLILYHAFERELRVASNMAKFHATWQVMAHAIKYAPYTHPNFEQAIHALLEGILKEEIILSQEYDIFTSQIQFLTQLFTIPFSSATLNRFGSQLFAYLMQQIGLFRSISPAASSSAAIHKLSDRSNTIETSRISLTEALQQFAAMHVKYNPNDGEGEPLVQLFRFYLPSLLDELFPSTESNIAALTCEDIGFCILTDVIQRIGTRGLFVASPPESAALAHRVELLVSQILTTNSHLAVHANLLESLIQPLTVAQTGSTEVAFSSDFLQQFHQQLPNQLSQFRTHYPLTTAPPAAGRLSREEELKFEATERVRLAQQALIKRYEQAVEQCQEASQKITSK